MILTSSATSRLPSSRAVSVVPARFPIAACRTPQKSMSDGVRPTDSRDLTTLNPPRALLAPGSPSKRESGTHELRRRSEEHTSELQSRGHLVCRLLLEKKKMTENDNYTTHE